MESAASGTNPTEFRLMSAKADPSDTSVPSVRVEGKTVRVESELMSLAPLFSEHRQVVGQPFTASYFMLDKVYPHLDRPDSIRIDRIESYVASEMASRHLSDSVRAASSILGELQEELSLSEDTDPYYRIERIERYLSAREEYGRGERLRASLMSSQRNRDLAGRFI